MRPNVIVLALATAIPVLPQATTLSHADKTRISSRQYLEDAARSLAARGIDPNAGEVVDAALSVSHYLQVPDTFRAGLRYQLILAESAFWRGASQGVREADIASAFNRMVRTLSLPEFAETSEEQVRVLRTRLIVRSPAFMGRNALRSQMQVGGRIEAPMSPVQAFHLVSTLIDQKFYNPEFQVSPKEWPAGLSGAGYAATPTGPGNAPGGRALVKKIDSGNLTRLREQYSAVVMKLSYADTVRLAADFESAIGLR